jgi:hypothetical protein
LKPPPQGKGANNDPAKAGQVAIPLATTAKAQSPQNPAKESSIHYVWWVGSGVVLMAAILLTRALARSRLGSQRSLPGSSSGQAGSSRISPGQTEAVMLTPQSVTGAASTDPMTKPVGSPVIRLEPSVAAPDQVDVWQERALTAEKQAAQAQAVIRGGLLPHLSHWLRQKFVGTMMADRARLLAAQQAAAQKASAVDQRLARIETQVREQNRSYQRRIEELSVQLLAAREENRELIRAQINLIKAEMEANRAKLLAEDRETGGK